MDSADRKYNCKTCDKNYSCYKSLWNHNKKFHKNIEAESKYLVSLGQLKVSIKCKYCNNEYKHKQSKSKHEKSCKKKKETTKIEELELEIKKMKEKLETTIINNTTNNNSTLKNH